MSEEPHADYLASLSKPAWSPDGSHISFVVAGLELDRAYVMRSDGSDVRPLTSGFDGSDPAWLPDGSALLYWGTREGIVAIDTAVSRRTIVSDLIFLSGMTRPSLAPSRVGLTYTTYLGGGPNIELLRFAAEPVCGLSLCFEPRTELLVANAHDAAWSPNGQALAFVRATLR